MDFMQAVVKFNTQTNGRDKLCRVVQYGSKFTYWLLEQLKKDPNLIKKLRNVEFSVSTTRKLLRFGKSLDALHSAQKAMHISDVVRRMTIALSNLNNACYLLFDHIIWLARVGVVKTDIKKWSELSSRFWLVSLILNLVRDVYELFDIFRQAFRNHSQQAKRSHYSNGDAGHMHITRQPLTSSQLVVRCLVDNKPVVLDTIKNGCDLILPLSSLKKINASPGTQGLAGIISSLVGIAVVWNPLFKMVP